MDTEFNSVLIPRESLIELAKELENQPQATGVIIQVTTLLDEESDCFYDDASFYFVEDEIEALDKS